MLLNSPFCLSLCQYYNTLRIRSNLGKMDKLRNKLVFLSKPVKVTDSDNNNGPLIYYTTELITAVVTLKV